MTLYDILCAMRNRESERKSGCLTFGYMAFQTITPAFLLPIFEYVTSPSTFTVETALTGAVEGAVAGGIFGIATLGWAKRNLF